MQRNNDLKTAIELQLREQLNENTRNLHQRFTKDHLEHVIRPPVEQKPCRKRKYGWFSSSITRGMDKQMKKIDTAMILNIIAFFEYTNQPFNNIYIDVLGCFIFLLNVGFLWYLSCKPDEFVPEE